MEGVKSKSNKVRYFWSIYPFLLILLGYIHQSLSNTYYPPFDKFISGLGVAFALFILPLIIVGMRKIFTKKELPKLYKILLFYGISILAFIIILLGNLLKS